MADKTTEIVTTAAVPLQAKPVVESNAPAAKKIAAAAAATSQDLINFFVENGYLFCEKCGQQIYTDEDRQTICSIDDPDCPKKTR
jgi:hypothetical protein